MVGEAVLSILRNITGYLATSWILLEIFLPPLCAAEQMKKVAPQLAWKHPYQPAGYYAALSQGYPDWLKLLAGLAIAICLLVGAVAVVLFLFNRRLRNEIKERKRAEDALIESENRFRKLIEQSPVVYEMYDKDGVQRMVNQAYAKLWGIDPRSTVGVFNLWKTEQSEKLRPHVEKAYAGEVMVLPEMYWDARKEVGQGRDRWISSIIYPLVDRHGKVDNIVILHEDVTQRRQADVALRESEEKFRNFAEQSLVGIYLIQDGFFKYVNPKFAELHDYTVEECLDDLPVTQLVHPDDRAVVHENMRKRLSGEVATVHYNFRGLKKNGDIIHAEVFGSTTMYNGKLVTIGTFLDITEKVEIENKLRQARKMEAVGTLAGGIAHEFNNVLGIIMGNTELAIDDLPQWNPTQRHLMEIKAACMRARDVVRQLLNFSRKTDVIKKPIDLMLVVSESLKLMRASIPSSIQINSQLPVNGCPVVADPTQIRQIIFNLCTNAAHAMSENGGQLNICLENIELDDQQASQYNDLLPGFYARLRVSDSGHGIAPNVLDKIFDPYFTTKEVGKGSGMGLSVIHGIVKAHAGAIAVKSDLNQGTTFDILFPAVPETWKEDTFCPGDDFPKGSEYILLIDDEPALIRSGEQILSRLGYRVQAQTNPLTALAMFQAQPQDYDLVISDMTMPQMTGDRLAYELLSIRKDIPIILCTGFSERLNQRTAQALGIREYVSKPLNTLEISHTIRQVLGHAV
jgi:two-component system cell cycle sensor histidine kinase/response regulator CckA